MVYFDLDKIVKGAIVTVLTVAMILLNVFFPYCLVNIFPKNHNEMILGIHYVLGAQIHNDLAGMNDTGFKVIKIWLDYNKDDLTSDINNKTTLFFYEAKEFFDFKIAVIVEHDDIHLLDAYLYRFGDYIDYIQILNEPEATTGWAPGALLIENEIFTWAQNIYNIVKLHNLNAQTYTNFSPAFVLRPNVVDFFKNYTDFIGYDPYTTGVIYLTPHFMSMLNKFSSNKRTIITEFGIMDDNDEVQADHIIEGLNFFKNMGFEECWLCYWDMSVNKGYNIGGRLAQERIKEWAQNG